MKINFEYNLSAGDWVAFKSDPINEAGDYLRFELSRAQLDEAGIDCKHGITITVTQAKITDKN